MFTHIFCLCSMQLESVWCRPFSSPLMTISRAQLCAPRRLNAWMGRWSWGPSVALSATWTAPIPSSLSSSDAFNSTNSTTRPQTSLWTSSMRWSLGNYTSRYDRLLKFKRSTQHPGGVSTWAYDFYQEEMSVFHAFITGFSSVANLQRDFWTVPSLGGDHLLESVVFHVWKIDSNWVFNVCSSDSASLPYAMFMGSFQFLFKMFY